MVDTRNNTTSTGIDCGHPVDTAAIVVQPTGNHQKSDIREKPATTMGGIPVVIFTLGMSVVASTVGVSSVAGRVLLVSLQHYENHASLETPSRQLFCQELMDFIHRQDVMLSDNVQRLSRLESEHICLSVQVVFEEPPRQPIPPPSHASEAREEEQPSQ
ncbi:hypothetical protein SESBI_03053 [Sesbania bispinosa]|nr:hypothetical protein SESBI_03053 [Sesbania bispinosa]